MAWITKDGRIIRTQPQPQPQQQQTYSQPQQQQYSQTPQPYPRPQPRPQPQQQQQQQQYQPRPQPQQYQYPQQQPRPQPQQQQQYPAFPVNHPQANPYHTPHPQVQQGQKPQISHIIQHNYPPNQHNPQNPQINQQNPQKYQEKCYQNSVSNINKNINNNNILKKDDNNQKKEVVRTQLQILNHRRQEEQKLINKNLKIELKNQLKQDKLNDNKINNPKTHPENQPKSNFKVTPESIPLPIAKELIDKKADSVLNQVQEKQSDLNIVEEDRSDKNKIDPVTMQFYNLNIPDNSKLGQLGAVIDEKIKMTNENKPPEEQKVLACPKCRKKLFASINKRSFGWKCYICKEEFETPFIRSATYFKQVIGTRKHRVALLDEHGNKIKGQYVEKSSPIRRDSKKIFGDEDIMKREDIMKMFSERYNQNIYSMGMKDIRDCAFIAFLFLTGARVEEVVGVRKKDEIGKFIKGAYDIEPIKKSQVMKMSYNKGKTILWVVENMPILKRRTTHVIDDHTKELKTKVHRRKVACILDYEKEFVKFIDLWMSHLMDDDYIFEFSRHQAWRICYAFNGKYNHFWRHTRATDLVRVYGFQSMQLKHFFGWASEKMAERYAHLSTENLVDSMLTGFEKQGIKIEEENKTLPMEQKDKETQSKITKTTQSQNSDFDGLDKLGTMIKETANIPVRSENIVHDDQISDKEEIDGFIKTMAEENEDIDSMHDFVLDMESEDV